MDSTDDKQWKCGTKCQVGWRMKKQINLKYFFEGEGTTGQRHFFLSQKQKCHGVNERPEVMGEGDSSETTTW